MAWKSIRKKITAQRLIRLFLAILAALLIHPERFSEPVIKIGGLKVSEIVKKLQTNYVMSSTDPYQDKCEVNLEVLGEWQPPAFEDQDIVGVKGGRWKPENCQPRFDSESFIILMVHYCFSCLHFFFAFYSHHISPLSKSCGTFGEIPTLDAPISSSSKRKNYCIITLQG